MASRYDPDAAPTIWSIPDDLWAEIASDVILRVIDPTKLQVLAAVPIPDLARVQVGQPARINVPNVEELNREGLTMGVLAHPPKLTTFATMGQRKAA